MPFFFMPLDGDIYGFKQKDLSRRNATTKAKIEVLEKKARMDPLKRKPEIHEELAKLKKQVA